MEKVPVKDTDEWSDRFLSAAKWALWMWIGCFVVAGVFAFIFGVDKVGQFGDSFGLLNTLFSGLAFATLIITMLMQRDELKLQREEMRQTRAELYGQREQLVIQNAISAKAALLGSLPVTVDRLHEQLRLLNYPYVRLPILYSAIALKECLAAKERARETPSTRESSDPTALPTFLFTQPEVHEQASGILTGIALNLRIMEDLSAELVDIAGRSSWPIPAPGEEAGPEPGPKKADESGTRASNAADTAGPTP